MTRYIPVRALEKITRLKRLRRKAPLSVLCLGGSNEVDGGIGKIRCILLDEYAPQEIRVT